MQEIIENAFSQFAEILTRSKVPKQPDGTFKQVNFDVTKHFKGKLYVCPLTFAAPDVDNAPQLMAAVFKHIRQFDIDIPDSHIKIINLELYNKDPKNYVKADKAKNEPLLPITALRENSIVIWGPSAIELYNAYHLDSASVHVVNVILESPMPKINPAANNKAREEYLEVIVEEDADEELRALEAELAEKTRQEKALEESVAEKAARIQAEAAKQKQDAANKAKIAAIKKLIEEKDKRTAQLAKADAQHDKTLRQISSKRDKDDAGIPPARSNERNTRMKR